MILFYTAVFLILIFDQLTKALALSSLPPMVTFPILPDIFHLTLVHNPGIAFGFFRQHPWLLLAVITVSLGIMAAFSMRMASMHTLPRLALAMILAGALGNWIDRVRYGYVVDFIDFRVWPVFNMADSFITLGVILYGIYLIRGEPKPK